MEYEYNDDTRKASIMWLSSGIKDTVWYADLTPITKSFKKEDLLEVGTIVKCPFGVKRKLYKVKFLGLGKLLSILSTTKINHKITFYIISIE